MKTIAFKRAKHPFLHPEFISEHVEATELKTLEGYETLLEDKFLVELAKGHKKQVDFIAKLISEETLINQAKQEAILQAAVEKKENERDYKRFKMWLKHQGKR